MGISPRQREVLDFDRMAIMGAVQSMLRVFDERANEGEEDDEQIAIDAAAMYAEKAIEKLKEALR